MCTIEIGRPVAETRADAMGLRCSIPHGIMEKSPCHDGSAKEMLLIANSEVLGEDVVKHPEIVDNDIHHHGNRGEHDHGDQQALSGIPAAARAHGGNGQGDDGRNHRGDKKSPQRQSVLHQERGARIEVVDGIEELRQHDRGH